MEKWIELGKVIREWADAIGLIVFCVGAPIVVLGILACWIRNRYYRDFLERRRKRKENLQ